MLSTNAGSDNSQAKESYLKTAAANVQEAKDIEEEEHVSPDRSVVGPYQVEMPVPRD